MPHTNRRIVAISAAAIAAIILVGSLALAAGQDPKGSPPNPSDKPFDSDGYQTGVASAKTANAGNLSTLVELYNSGSRDYLSLPIETIEVGEISDPLSLSLLARFADTAFIGDVASIRWAAGSDGVPQKLVSYAAATELIYGEPLPGTDTVMGHTNGPVPKDPVVYITPPLGVRERVGERYLVFASHNSSGYFAGGDATFIRIDGGRIANSEAAKALGIEGQQVSGIVAELRRLKSN